MQQESLSSVLLATVSRLYLCLLPGRLIRSKRKLLAAVMILLVGISLPTFPQKSTSKVVANPKPPSNPSAAAPATGGSKSTFTITVDQNYCDVSLPYTYASTKQDLKLNVQSTGNWNTVLQNSWNQFPQLPASAVPGPAPTAGPTPAAGNNATSGAVKNAKIDLTFSTFPPPTPMISGGADDPPVLDDGKPARAEINDEGDALLGDPTQELHTNAFDVQRLLVRTLFGPNPFQLACAYPYLKYPNGFDDTISKAQLKLGADGKPFDLLGKGSGYAFSLNGSKSPQYFLIDVVRWNDAAVPSGGPSVPFFQPVSDDWYLFNYSDWKERPQDISKWFHPISPALANETLRIVGSNQVMFLAIHLAPMISLDPDKSIKPPSTVSVKGIPTEQAWYDDVVVKYSIQASAYEPTQMQDLDDLVQILGTYLVPSAAAPQATGVPSPAPPPPTAAPSTVPTIDNFLRQSMDLNKPILLSTYQGRYAAALLTNLTALPVNLTNTWTAIFSSSNNNVINSSSNSIGGKVLAYDTRSVADIQKAAASANPSTPPASSAPPCAAAVDLADKTKQADCNVTGAKVQNEGLAHWDVSVVVPASSYSDVTFQASTTTGGTNSITAKTVSRTNAYAVLDLFLYPEDLVRPPNVGLPHLIVGLPFAGKVFDKPYFAVGETFNLPNTLGKLKIFNWIPGVSSLVSTDLPLSIRPTFGWVYNKVFPTPGSSASYRSLKPQFGVEISISGLVKTLSKSSGGTPKTTTPSTVPSTN